MPSALVLSGNTKNGMWLKDVVRPKFVFPSVKELLHFLHYNLTVSSNT